MRFRVFWAAALVLSSVSSGVDSQVLQRNAQYWLPASYNNRFYDLFNHAARSFYAAHVAHFGVYEVGISEASPDSAMLGLERRIASLIQQPPRFEPAFELIAPKWSRMAYQTGAAMDWTHHLHEQLYDILADDRVEDKKTAGERAIAYYLSNVRSAFSTRGYGHAFMMGGGSWAGTFAERYPSVNGILWAYHWHHAAIYEALMEENLERRREAIDRVLRVFHDSVLVDPPQYMPLTAEIAPRFGEMFPAAAHIFDNLHMMHDVANDIVADATIPLNRKGAEIERILRQMLYANQEWVIPPELPHEAHGSMPMSAQTVPTQLPDGSWLPQGHPRASHPGMAPMSRGEGGHQ